MSLCLSYESICNVTFLSIIRYKVERFCNPAERQTVLNETNCSTGAILRILLRLPKSGLCHYSTVVLNKWTMSTLVRVFPYLVSSTYTDSSTNAAYSRFFLRSVREASPLSSCFTRHRNLKQRFDSHLTNWITPKPAWHEQLIATDIGLIWSGFLLH